MAYANRTLGRWGRRGVIGTFVLALGLVAVLVQAGPVSGQAIRWSSGAVSAPQPLSALEAARDIRAMVRDVDKRRVILQFNQPISPSERERLKLAGVDVLDFLGSNAYFATVRSDALRVNRLSQVQSLQAAMPVAREFKTHRLLLEQAPPAWTIVGEAEVPAADGEPATDEADPMVAVNVLFHRDVPRATTTAIADEHGGTVGSILKSVNALVIELPWSAVMQLADRDEVQWVEPPLPPLTDLNAENREVTQANIVQAPPYGLDGSGVHVMVFDGGTALASHSDFGGRVNIRDGDGTSNHATHVSGTIGGDGALSDGELRGMAPNVIIESYGFEWSSGGIFLYTNPGDIEQDYSDAINAHGAVIANNSIGTNTASNGFPCEITGEYGLTDTIIDAIVRGSLGAPIRVVWANGNERNSTNCGQEYYTTAPPACAKNHLTVGALNSDDNSVTGFTSWGPANDGRLKPDISAPGCQIGSGVGVESTSSSGGYTNMCGTSMASPTVAGLAALLLQDYREQFPGEPDFLPSTMKTLFVHTALDLENVGPDFQTGYGLAQVQDAVDFMRSGNFIEAEITHGNMIAFTVIVGDGVNELKATLAWDDHPSVPNAIPALVNDLDLRVTGPDGTFFPWNLDPDNPAAPATQDGPDRVNNIEQVLVSNPTPGQWTVEVIGFNIPEGPQKFSLAAGPSLVSTIISFPEGVPALIEPAAPTEVPVRIRTQSESLVEGSAMLNYRVDGGSFVSVPLDSADDDEMFLATLPGVSCAQQLEYYISAEGTISGELTNPAGAPLELLHPEIGVSIEVFADSFDSDLGWIAGVPEDTATSGHWELANPVGTSTGGQQAQPSGAFVGDMCYITGQHPGGGAGANDVDNGQTTLISPLVDLTGFDRVTIGYWRWYSNSAGADPFTDIFEVDISNDGGATWHTVEVVGPDGSQVSGGWFRHEFNVADIVSLTDQVRMRFIASDFDPQSLVEAAVDAFIVDGVVCEDSTLPCPGDLNGDGETDTADLLTLLGAWGVCNEVFGCPPGDLNDDGAIGTDDLLLLLGAWGPCP